MDAVKRRKMVLPSTNRQIDIQQAKVLIIEDKLDTLAIMQRLLMFSGFNPKHCFYKSLSYGVIQFAEYTQIDLILLDLFFSSQANSGYEVLAQIRKHPSISYTRTIAITGHVDQMQQTRAAGFDGFIAKPLQLDSFPGQIRRILNGEPVWENR